VNKYIKSYRSYGSKKTKDKNEVLDSISEEFKRFKIRRKSIALQKQLTSKFYKRKETLDQNSNEEGDSKLPFLFSFRPVEDKSKFSTPRPSRESRNLKIKPPTHFSIVKEEK